MILLTMAFWGPPVVRSARAAGQSASIDTYLPRLQLLVDKMDWAGLEQLSRQALSDMKLHGSGSDVQRAALYLGSALRNQRRYQEAEALYRSLLASDEQVLGPDHPVTATALDHLAVLLMDQGRYREAEPLFKRSVAIREKALGPDHPDVATTLHYLASLYVAQGQYAQAEPLFKRSLAIREKALGANHPDVAQSLNSLAALYQQQGQYAQAQPLSKRSLAIREKALGPDHPDVATSLSDLAALYVVQGQYAQAEPLYRRALAIWEKALGPDHPDVATGLNDLALLYDAQGQYAQAEPLHRRAVAIWEKALGPDHPYVATGLNSLASLYVAQGQYAQAEPLYQRSLAIREKALGPDHPDVAQSLSSLAGLYQQQGQYAQAEPLYQRALAIWEKALGPDHPNVATGLNDLAWLYDAQGRYAQAEPMLKQALAIDVKALGPDHPIATIVHENLGQNYEFQAKFDDATTHYRLACSTRSLARSARELSSDAAQAAERRSNSCSTRLSLALWGWYAQGGGTAAADHPDALKLEAFAASQRAVQSAAAEAMARSAALTAAKTSAVGPQALAYEAALLERDGLDQKFARAVANGGAGGVEQRQTLAKAHDEVLSRIDQLASELKNQAPRYWDYRSPEAVSVAALQATTGPDAALLHDDEALIVLLVVPGKDKGLVFALNKDQVAWARLGLTGDEIKARVLKLRTQIDPEGYGLQGAAPGANAGAAISNAGAFDRRAAYELYQALLGDASIQAVINEKPVLLFVPSGALTSLPPGLLVTAPPAGGAPADANPGVLRATPWLLRSKAVALLPAVSSLRTLRQILPAARASTPDPLLVFADPDFSRLGTAPKTRVAAARVRGFSTYFRDGVPLADALDHVPSLPGTRIEGEALERALQGKPGSLLTGRSASKAELMARNGDGRLAQVRVLEFATHGLVAGDASDLAEPALVLAAGATPADELLLASEAATLKLNADWVLLSACNTASPDAPEAQGLSGLSRAFFYAGAKSLLVSHWRVRDDVAPRLIPAMLVAERKTAGLARAEALRQASLAILDDRSLNAADPAAWAPFTLVGEAGR